MEINLRVLDEIEERERKRIGMSNIKIEGYNLRQGKESSVNL